VLDIPGPLMTGLLRYLWTW